MSPLNVFLAIMALVFILGTNPYEASRVPYGEEEEKFMKNENRLLQSLQKAIVPPGPNGGTTVPRPPPTPTTTTTTTINERSFAGHAMPPPHANPHVMVPFGVASNRK